MKDILTSLNNNPSIISTIGWLVVFLFGIYTQRTILKLNLRWKLFTEYTELRDSYKGDTFYTILSDRTVNLLEALAKMPSGDHKDNEIIWTCFLEKETKDFKEFEIYFTKISQKIDLITAVTPKVLPKTKELYKKFGELHFELLKHLEYLREMDKVFNPRQVIEKCNELDIKIAEFINTTLTNFDTGIFHLMFGYTFGNKKPRNLEELSSVKAQIRFSEKFKNGVNISGGIV